MTIAASRIHAVRWRSPEPPSGAALARLRSSVQAADWEVAGSPSALLVVKALEVTADPARSGPTLDGQALRGRLARAWEASIRPAAGRLPGDAAAVRFEDEGEALAAYLVARWEGTTHWCWDLLRKGRLSSDPWQAVLESPFRLPGIMAYLRAWGTLEGLLRDRAPASLRRASVGLCRALELRPFSAWLAESGQAAGPGGPGEDPDGTQAGSGAYQVGDVPPEVPMRPWEGWWRPGSGDLHPEAELLAGLALGAWENRACLSQPWFFGEVRRWRLWAGDKAGKPERPERPESRPHPGTSAGPAGMPGSAAEAGSSAAPAAGSFPGNGKARGREAGGNPAGSPRDQGNMERTPGGASGPHPAAGPSMVEAGGAGSVTSGGGAAPGGGVRSDRTEAGLPSDPVPGGPGGSRAALPGPATAASRPWARSETVLHTGWAGVFFLLPMLRRLGWPDRPLPGFPALGAWALLEASAACLAARAGDDFAAAWESEPLRRALPAWDPDDDRPDPEAAGRGPGPSVEDRRKEAILALDPILPAAAGKALRLEDPREVVREMLLKPGRVYRGACHVDVVLPLQSVSLAVRRAGLDQNPGWQPWLGRVVGFHFL